MKTVFCLAVALLVFVIWLHQYYPSDSPSAVTRCSRKETIYRPAVMPGNQSLGGVRIGGGIEYIPETRCVAHETLHCTKWSKTRTVIGNKEYRVCASYQRGPQ